MLTIPLLKLTFSHDSCKGYPPCMVVWAEWARCAITALEEQIPEGSAIEEVSQSLNCLLPAKQQTVDTPLGWVNRNLCTFLWTFTRVSLLDQR